MIKLCSLIFVVVIFYNVLPSQGITTGWLRFCNDGFTWRANPNECPGGYWLKKSIRPQCVCAHGVWILSKGYCDPNYVVVVGYHGTCFAFDAEVHWIRMVGYANNPFAPYYFVANRYLDRIEPTDAAMGSAVMEDIQPLVGAISPQKPQDDPKAALCILPRQVPVAPSPDIPPEGREGVAFNFSPVKWNSDRWSFSQVEQCSPNSSELAYAYGASYSQVFQYQEAKVNDWVYHNCSNTCLRKNEWSIEIALQKKLNESELSGDNLKEDYPFSSESNDFIFDDLRPKCNNTDNNWHQLPNRTINEINEQTKRLMRTHINWSLYQHKGPEVNLTEYNIFQKSRRIFEKVCPRDHVPPAMLRGVLRMFRHALNESHPDDPYRRRGDQAEFTRIIGALQQCFDAPDDQAISFVYNTTVCPAKLSAAIYKFKNKTAPFDARNVSCYMPCELRFNTTKYDVPVEAAWKVVLFTHYLCARHFKDIGYDHSRYVRKMEEFFNREIIHRWNNKGNSLKAMEYLFQMYDLEKFTKGMDCCVGAARSVSQYRKWLKRPMYYQYCGQKNGQSYLNYKTPPKDYKPENRFAMSNNGGRYYNNDTDPIWDGHAYCFTDWWDPLTAIPGYKDEALSACGAVAGTFFWEQKFSNLVR